MAGKDFLERMLSMLPEEFQDIYDDTIPKAKEIRKKTEKMVSSVKSYSRAMPMLDLYVSPNLKKDETARRIVQEMLYNPIEILSRLNKQELQI